MTATHTWGRTEQTRAIGRRIREERVAAGLYRREFAKLVGMTPRQLGRYENGWPISDVRLAKVANALGRAFGYMRTGQGDPVGREFLAPPTSPTAPVRPFSRLAAERQYARDNAPRESVVVMTRDDVVAVVRQAVAEALLLTQDHGSAEGALFRSRRAPKRGERGRGRG